MIIQSSVIVMACLLIAACAAAQTVASSGTTGAVGNVPYISAASSTSATLGSSPISISGSNVGIGTAPSTALTVAGDVTVTPVGGLSVVITSRTGTTFASSPVLVPTNGTLFVGPANNPPVGLGVDNLGTPAVFVGQTELNNGNVQVGGASDPVPEARLHLRSAISEDLWTPAGQELVPVARLQDGTVLVPAQNLSELRERYALK